jgi:hypothetical protein
MLTASDKKILAKAADIIQAGWCRGVSAMDKCGNERNPGDGDATRFCILGSVEKALIGNNKEGKFPEKKEPQYQRITGALDEAVPCFNILTWNDMESRRKGDVVKLLKKLAAS